MSSEKVEDLRAARYRLIHMLRDHVGAMAIDVECDRDAILHDSLCKVAITLGALNNINQALLAAYELEAEGEAEA